mgnify:CR=1 FL=1
MKMGRALYEGSAFVADQDIAGDGHAGHLAVAGVVGAGGEGVVVMLQVLDVGGVGGRALACVHWRGESGQRTIGTVGGRAGGKKL